MGERSQRRQDHGSSGDPRGQVSNCAKIHVHENTPKDSVL
jgi:hypothetical protein